MRYETYGLKSLTAFLRYIMSDTSPSFMCGVRLTEQGKELLIFFQKGEVAVFFCDGELEIFYPNAIVKTTVLGVVDERWGNVYFLPKSGFLIQDDAIGFIEQYFSGLSFNLVSVPQNTQETYAAYKKMLADGKIHEDYI